MNLLPSVTSFCPVIHTKFPPIIVKDKMFLFIYKNDLPNNFFFATTGHPEAIFFAL